MSEEKELLRLYQRYKETNQTQQLSDYFSKLIAANRKIEITDSIRSILPAMASIHDGVFINMLNSTINGITPMHFIPDLTCVPKPPGNSAPRARNPRSARSTTKDLSSLNIRELSAYGPRTSRRSKSEHPKVTTMSLNMKAKSAKSGEKAKLPPLKEADNVVIPHLYSCNTAFFVCKGNEQRQLQIIPPTYPKEKIGNNYTVISKQGLMTLENDHSSFVQLHQYFKDKTDEYICERQMFRQRRAYRTFYMWIAQFKMHQLERKSRALNERAIITHSRFSPVADKVRLYLRTMTEDLRIWSDEFDSTTEDVEFIEYKSALAETMDTIEGVIVVAAKETSRQLAEFFNEIRAMNALMKLNFDELNSINALPKDLKKYLADLKWKSPSLYYDKLRDNELNRQRELAERREDYIQEYFKKINSLYTGDLILKAKQMILDFLDKFNSLKDAQRRLHKLHGIFDEKLGVCISPTKEEFQLWITRTVEHLKRVFLEEHKLLEREIVTDIFPHFQFEFEDPINVINRFVEIQKAIDAAIKSSNDAYQWYEEELKANREFVRKLFDAVETSRRFSDLRDVEKLEGTIRNLLEVRDELSKRPRHIFHKIQRSGENGADYVIDMRPAWESSNAILTDCMNDLRDRAVNELNNSLFTELQNKWSADRDKKITKAMCSAIEARMLMYSIMAVAVINAWPETMSDVKGGFETIMRLYQQLADKSKYTHIDAATHFNKAADRFGIQIFVRLQEEEEEEEDANDDEYEYEYDDDAK